MVRWLVRAKKGAIYCALYYEYKSKNKSKGKIITNKEHFQSLFA